MKNISKKEANEKIKELFSNIKNRTSKEVKKIKRAAMKQNIKLKEYKKKFCKKCFSPYENPKIRIHKGIKSVTCEKCGKISRYKLKK